MGDVECVHYIGITNLARELTIEQAHAQLQELLPTKRYREMSQALSVSLASLPLPEAELR